MQPVMTPQQLAGLLDGPDPPTVLMGFCETKPASGTVVTGEPGLVTRVRHGRGTDGSRETHGSVTRLASREGDAGNVTLPCVSGDMHLRAE